MATTALRPSELSTPPQNRKSIEPLYSDHRYASQSIRASVPMVFADCISLQCALWIGHFLVSFSELVVANHFLLFAIVVQAAFLVVNSMIGLYPGVGIHPAKELQHLFRAVNLANLLVALALMVVSRWYSPYALALVVSYPLQLALLPLFRGLARHVAKTLGMSIPFYYFGELNAVFEAQKELNRFGWSRMKPAGRLHPPQENWDANFDSSYSMDKFCASVPRFETPEELVAAARKDGVFLLVIAGQNDSELGSLFSADLRSILPQVVFVNPEPSSLKIGASVVSWGICDGLKVEDALLMPGSRWVKRALDVVITLAVLFTLAPMLAILAFLVWVTSEGPVVYGHSRIGFRGRSFKAWKFRTMVANADEVLQKYLDDHAELRAEWELNQKLKDDPRITRIGRILRKTSLDELPQLFNVLLGQMSLVGPRPIVKSEIAKYGDTFASYLRVVPGITGLWQISGRNNTTYAERLKYDTYYVHNWSPWLDYYILLRTVKTVLRCEGAY